MRQIAFTKMVASGNDFLVVDATSSKFKGQGVKPAALAIKMCGRKFGAGADGMLFLEKSKKANFRMRVFNPDGSEPDMCGNGARCAALFFKTNNPKLKRSDLRFETGAGIIEAQVKSDVIKLKMTDPKDLWANIDLNISTQFYKVHYVNTGVPHTVFFIGNVETVAIKEVGKQIRFHKQFQPEGTNVNFAQIVDNRTIKVRTYERGVEDETLACGTGSVASALLSFYLKLTHKSPVSVNTRSQEVLKVYFDYKDNKFSNIWLEGSARIVYEGGFNV